MNCIINVEVEVNSYGLAFDEAIKNSELAKDFAIPPTYTRKVKLTEHGITHKKFVNFKFLVPIEREEVLTEKGIPVTRNKNPMSYMRKLDQFFMRWHQEGESLCKETK